MIGKRENLPFIIKSSSSVKDKRDQALNGNRHENKLISIDEMHLENGIEFEPLLQQKEEYFTNSKKNALNEKSLRKEKNELSKRNFFPFEVIFR